MGLDPGTSVEPRTALAAEGSLPMLRMRLCNPVGWLALLIPCTAFSADDSSAEALLKSKGLRRQGTTYVLPGEAEFSQKLGTARATYRGFTTAVMQQESLTRNLEINRGMIQQLTQQRIFLNQRLSQVTTAQENNRLIGMINELTDRINLLNNASDDTGTSKEIRAQVSNRREAYIQALLDLRALTDSTAKTYDELGDDAEVTDALAALNGPSKSKVTLGPSRTYLANVRLLEKAEGGILTDTIQLRSDNGVFWVDVTLNGKTTIPMVFDTGAGIVSLGAADAAKAGLVPSSSDRTITLQVADGSSHEGKLMTLASVRVGKFTVQNVECAVSSKEKSDVPPLLGGPFLKHFTFKMNQAAGTVTFSKIETPEAATPKAVGKGKALAPARRARTSRPKAAPAVAKDETP